MHNIPQICMGFEVHQPYRLNRMFPASSGKVNKSDPADQYFDPINRDILVRVAEKCYTPATTILLGLLDEGFSVALSLSGTLVEQLEKWSRDTLSLFEDIAGHKSAELVGQTYYHSIASCFTDKSEFREQVSLHSDLMHDYFRVRPAVFENTEFTFNNQVAATIREMHFSGIFTEGVNRVLGWRSPNHLYRCQDLPVLLRNTTLSDDIAFRFANRSWDMYPLTADTYAGWIASSPGDLVTIFLDFETFGEHFWQETGIFDFLRSLPGELESRGVTPVLPSHIVSSIEPVGEIDVPKFISWADIEKDTSAWMGNDRQKAAFSAVQEAKPYATDKKVWRYLQTSDHFYYMASKYGTCGEVHSYFSHHNPDEAFRTFMSILADYESRNIRFMRSRTAATALRTVSPQQAFYFASSSGFIGHIAFNLDQFEELLSVIPGDSIRYHQGRGDFSRWITDVIGDPLLAGKIKGVNERHELVRIVKERRTTLWNHLK